MRRLALTLALTLPSLAARADDLPEQLSRVDVLKEMRRIEAATENKCSDGSPRRLLVDVEIANSGRVDKAGVRNADIGDTMKKCVVDTLTAQAQFPRFSGTVMKVSFPFQWRSKK